MVKTAQNVMLNYGLLVGYSMHLTCFNNYVSSWEIVIYIVLKMYVHTMSEYVSYVLNFMNSDIKFNF